MTTMNVIDRLKADPDSAVAIRDFRRMVAQTASLVSTDGPVHETMATGWWADMEERTIGWRTTHPFPPFEVIDEDEMLVLVAHEAAHLNLSGKHGFPDDMKTEEEKVRFHRFVNAVEDVRIERTLGSQFAGFWKRSTALLERCRGWLAPTANELHPVDQVGLSFCFVEKGLQPVGDVAWQQFAIEKWAEVDRAIATSDSTAALADAVLPVYYEILDAMQQQPDGEPGGKGDEDDSSEQGDESQDGGEAEGTGSQPGEQEAEGGSQQSSGGGHKGTGGKGEESDELDELGDEDELEDYGDTSGDLDSKDVTDKPVRSDGEDGTDPLPVDEQIREMRDDAKGQARDLLDEADTLNEDEKDAAEAQKEKVQSHDGKPGRYGNSFNTNPHDTSWDAAANLNRPQINLLTSRLRSVLRTNAMDNWQSGQRRGRLDGKRAYRANAGNPRIFKQRKAVGGLDYTFGILVDCSGSMGGEKSQGALQAAVIVAEALERVGLDSFILPWQTIPGVIKPLGSKLAQHRGKIGSQITHPGGGTSEECALIVAQSEFRRVQGKKVLFTISDGQTHKVEESEQLIEELTREGVHCVSIGVGFPAPKHHPRRITVKNGQELADTMPRLIQEFVRRGA